MDKEKDYMMLKSFSLLLNDNRKKRKDYESSFLFAISNSKFSKSPAIIDKETSIFLNISTTIDILIEKLIPQYRKPYVYIKENEELEFSKLKENSNINWEKTLEKWSKDIETKNEIYVCSTLKESPDKLAINVIAKIISEVILHAEILLEELRSNNLEIHSPTYNDLIKQIEKKITTLKLFIDRKLKQFLNFDKKVEFEQNVNNLFKNVLHQNSGHWGITLFDNYRRKINITYDGKSQFASMIVKVRNQYLDCKVWIYEEIKLLLKQYHDMNKLFEFFCFIEVIDGFKREDYWNVIPNIFLSTHSRKPLTKIGHNHLIFYDYREKKFQKGSIQTQLSSAISNIFVEWIIVNNKCLTKSILIDTKFRKWDSRETLKVIGYLSCYGINYGVIIFKEKPSHDIDFGDKLGDNIVRVNMKNNQHLYILFIKPSRDCEDDNKITINLLINDLRKKRVLST